MKFKTTKEVDVEVTRDDFFDYVEVQEEGLFNMFDPQARALTDLSKEVWVAIMSNYDELAKEYKN
jgi:hypothetical protein